MLERSKEDNFVGAADNGDIDTLRTLLAEGVDINCKDSLYQNAAIHRAASMGSKKTVDFLLSQGASINALNGNEMTPLMNACSKGKKKGSEVALLLLKHGADAVYARQGDGMTALKFALWGQCTPAVFDALIQAGANMPEKDFEVIRLV